MKFTYQRLNGGHAINDNAKRSIWSAKLKFHELLIYVANYLQLIRFEWKMIKTNLRPIIKDYFPINKLHEKEENTRI